MHLLEHRASPRLKGMVLSKNSLTVTDLYVDMVLLMYHTAYLLIIPNTSYLIVSFCWNIPTPIRWRHKSDGFVVGSELSKRKKVNWKIAKIHPLSIIDQHCHPSAGIEVRFFDLIRMYIL